MLSDTLTAVTSSISLATRTAFGSEYTAAEAGEHAVYLFLAGLKSPAIGILSVQFSVDFVVKRVVGGVTTNFNVGDKPQWNKRDVTSTAETKNCGTVYLAAGDKLQIYVTSSNALDTTTTGSVLLHPTQQASSFSDTATTALVTALVTALANSQSGTFAGITTLLNSLSTVLGQVVTTENSENTSLTSLLTQLGQVATTVTNENTTLQGILVTLQQLLLRAQGLPPTGAVGAGE